MTEEQELQFLFKHWKKIPIISTELIMNKFPKVDSPWKHWNNIIDVLKDDITQENESFIEQNESKQIKKNTINNTINNTQLNDHTLNNIPSLDDNKLEDDTIDTYSVDNYSIDNESVDNYSIENDSIDNYQMNNIQQKINTQSSYNIDKNDESINIDYRTDVSEMDNQSICSLDDNWN